MTEQLKPIYGEGGGKGGGGGRQAQEAANTLRSTATVKVVEVLSEGPIEGICGGAKGIYINDTPLQNSTGGDNFARVAFDYRVGLPNQTYMPGFPSVMSEIIVGAPVNKVAGPVIRTTSAANIDAMIVTIQLPQGLATQDMSSGDINGGKVEFSVEKKLSSSGAWSSAVTYGIEGKTTSPYEHL